MSESSANRTRLLALLVVVMAAVIFVPRLKPEARPDRRPCPQEFSQTRMAATLLWNRPEVGYVAHEPSPVEAHHPDDLRLLGGEADEPVCARIAAAIPDSLKPLGLLAPRLGAFYQLGDLYVAPVVPNLTAAEINAASRGDIHLERVGVTFVFDAGMNVVSAVTY